MVTDVEEFFKTVEATSLAQSLRVNFFCKKYDLDIRYVQLEQCFSTRVLQG